MPVHYIPSLPRLVLFCLLFAFAGAGCVPKQAVPDLDKYRQDEEEIVQEPYTPRDDGIPLTAAELKAFQSAGQLDRNLSQEDRAIVELHFKHFVHARRGTFERFLERTSRYLPYIRTTFKQRGIPEELAYLAMVESGGNPNAISPVGATGLWQFMPYTGKKFGLTQNTWIDERRDPFRATYAASDYLLKLHDDFGDWLLAAAAYNAGEGKIGRAIEGTGASDFFELCRLDCNLEEKLRLKAETRQYVPRLLAMVKIMRNLRLLGFTEPSPAAAYNLTPVSVPAGTNLSAFARNLGLTWDEFSAINPAFRRTASPPVGSATAYVPPEQKSTAEAWLASADARSYTGWGEHTVAKKDSLGSIAKRYKVSATALQQANSFSKLPAPGSVILIPGKSEKIEPVFAALPDSANPASKGTEKYTTQEGDTLFSLAKAWGTDVSSIRLANRLGPDQKIVRGQRLTVPGNSKNPPVAAKPEPARIEPRNGKNGASTYTVQPSDTLAKIAKANNTTEAALRQANGLGPTAKLNKGQTLTLPGKAPQNAVAPAPAKDKGAKPIAGGAPQPSSQAKQPTAKVESTKSIQVQQGDTLYSLARKNGTSVEALLKANGLPGNATVKAGQTLRLP